MAFDQGIDFRATAGFVTDPTGCDKEIGTTANYPRTSAQGNTVGWEDAPGGTRDRTNSVDARLAGVAFAANATPKRYRIDLPSSGWYRITLAIGDNTTVESQSVGVYDNTTVVSNVVGKNVATAAGTFFDACGIRRSSAANWVTNEISFVAFFSSTICRIKIADGGTASGNSTIAHVRVTDDVAPSPSFNCGIDFRGTSQFVTDPTNCSPHINRFADYPHINAQGIVCGWEQAPSSSSGGDGSAAIDARLAGCHAVPAGTQSNFRIDLPGAGSYRIAAAIGFTAVQGSPSQTVELFDSASSLGTIVSGGNTGASQWYDATGTLQTSAANWVANQQQITKTFATTILRFKCGIAAGGTASTTLAHVSVTQLTGFNGSSSLTASITEFHRLAATLAGTSALSATVQPRHPIAPTLAGTSTLTAAVSPHRPIAPTLAGTSTLSATISAGGVVQPIAVTLAGTSTLSGRVGHPDYLTPTLAGTSTLTASVVQTDYLNVSFDGVGQLYLGTPTPPDISVTLAGTSSLRAGLGIGVTLAGTSSLTASFKRAQFTVELHGEGHLTVFGDLGPPGMRLSQIVNEIAYVGDLPTVVLSQVTIEVARKRSGLRIWATSGKGFA